MAYQPKRIAPPSIIADAASVLHALTEQSVSIPDAERDWWHNAIQKAHSQLMDGVRWERDGEAMIFPSRSRSGLRHRCNGACDCEASTAQHRPCWHRAAKRLIELIEEAERVVLLDQPLAPPQCGACGAAMFQHNARYLCPVCRRTRLVPVPPRQPRTEHRRFTAEEAERIRRDMDELFA